jgi:hypothetical protein
MDTPPPASPESQPPAIPPSGGIDEKQWKVILHLSALSGLIIPAGNIIAPLAIWLIKKPEMPGLDPEAKNVLNFQISIAIYMIAAVVLAMVGSCLIIPIALPFVVGIFWLVVTIIGGVKTSNGETYTFPLSIKMLS